MAAPSEKRVEVAVTRARAELREMQVELNQVLWTTDLGYAYARSSLAAEFENLSRTVDDALGHIWTEAWHMNNKGRKKLNSSLQYVAGRFAEGGANRMHLYRSVMIAWFSYFEGYLNERLGKRRSWGPYMTSLWRPSLVEVRYPLRLQTVLRADLCRMLRNRLVHEPLKVPRAADVLMSGETSFQTALTQWSCSENDVRDACRIVIGAAVSGVRRAEKKGKLIPLELFYALYSFTNLDNLAFEIEEALSLGPEKRDSRIQRDRREVRARHMIQPYRRSVRGTSARHPAASG